MTATIIDLVPPASEPVDLVYAKIFLRIDHDHEDALITDLLRAARLRVEALIGGSLISRLRRYSAGRLLKSGLLINHMPISAVTAVRAVDAAGKVTELDTAMWQVNLKASPARLTLCEPYRWRIWDAVSAELDVTAGYGDADAVPMPLKQAVLLLLAQSYEYRDAADSPSLPFMVDALIMPYRSIKL